MGTWTPEELEDTRHDLPGGVTQDLVDDLVQYGAKVTFSNGDDEDDDPRNLDTMFVNIEDAEDHADVYRVLLLGRLHADEVDEEDDDGLVLRLWWD